MRLVHAADLHLDSPLRGLSRLGDADTARTLRAASRRALENLVELVIEQKACLLLLAGDVYDGDWNDYGTGRFFTRQMDRLYDEQIRVVMVSGNHDAQSEITRSLRLPPNVTALDVAEPQSVVLDDHGVVVHGQGFARKAVLDNLAAAYPDRHQWLINIGLLHTSVNDQEGHERYAPCSLDDLLAKGYEYFALLCRPRRYADTVLEPLAAERVPAPRVGIVTGCPARQGGGRRAGSVLAPIVEV